MPQSSANNIRRDFANGSHVVIFLLRHASNCIMCQQSFNPVSDIPHLCCADNIRRDFANGAHVVIFGLRFAQSCSIFAHNKSPASDIPHVTPGVVNSRHDADNILSDVANGAHVVICRLPSAFRFCMRLHICNPLSDMPHGGYISDMSRETCKHRRIMQCDVNILAMFSAERAERADNVTSEFANGAHVVILSLQSAFKFSI